MLVLADNEHIFLSDSGALAGCSIGPGGIDLSCRVEPPPCLALVLRLVVRVCRPSSLAPFLRMDKRV